jgi:D-serine deaminase-like pyridoxal phosphate-dependent protein
MAGGLEWYQISEIDEIDSPSLVVYRERILNNLKKMIRMTGNPDRLMPHVKTHKMEAIIKLQLSLGIRNFKCATLAEAEMTGAAGGENVLIAHQPVGPKFGRLINLIRKYPGVNYSVVIDNPDIARTLDARMEEAGVRIGVYMDINTGMNRTGIRPGGEARNLTDLCLSLKNIDFIGFHAYDGHNTLTDPNKRKELRVKEFMAVDDLLKRAEEKSGRKLKVVSGGTPTFPVHAEMGNTICSPGTTVLWDWVSDERFPELPFEYAAVLVTRIVSIIDKNTICLDLGHKAVAAEMPLPRVLFLNHPEAAPVSQSEEHLVVSVPGDRYYQPGDVFYAVPRHICPTCALYAEAVVCENHHWVDNWAVTAHNRFITV